MKMNLKKKDVVLIIVIICVAVGAYLLHHVLKDTGSGDAVVKVKGVIEGTYSLSEDQEIPINEGSNVLEIRNGKADMIDADCPDQLCVHQKAISLNGESIICLPNKIIVEVRSQKDSKLDAVTN